MPEIGYKNQLIPSSDLNQGQIITPPNREFPVADYRAQMAFTQAMGKVNEVLLQVEQNRKWATLQSLKTLASDDAAADLQDIKLLTDSDQIEPLSAQKRAEREKSYKEMATKAGLDYESEVYPKIETVFRKRELNEKAFKADLINKDNSNMMFGQTERYKRAMIQSDLTEDGEREFRNYAEGRKTTIDEMVNQRIISRQVGDTMIAETESIKQQRLEGYIKKLWNAGQPEKAVELLQNGTMANLGMDPVKIPELTQSSLTMARVTQGQRQAEEAKLLKANHDAEERNIGMMVLNGQYRQALQAVKGSKFLTGDELAKWGNSIETNATKEVKVDPVAQATEIVKINGMISKSEDPKKIRNYIIQSPSLKEGDKEQYLNKLETRLGSEMEEGRKTGYKDIDSMIIKKRGIMGDLLPTPSETVATAKAQMALDDWLGDQKKQEKALTIKEIRLKAFAIAEDYQVPLADRIEETQAEAIKTARETLEAAEAKIAKEKEAKKAPPAPPIVRQRIQ